MARAPFSNAVPDYVVVGPRFAAEGYGGVLAAGFLDQYWRVPAHAWAAAATYSAVC